MNKMTTAERIASCQRRIEDTMTRFQAAHVHAHGLPAIKRYKARLSVLTRELEKLRGRRHTDEEWAEVIRRGHERACMVEA